MPRLKKPSMLQKEKNKREYDRKRKAELNELSEEAKRQKKNEEDRVTEDISAEKLDNRMKKTREKVGYKANEKVATKLRMKEKRLEKRYRTREKRIDRCRKQQKRQCQVFRSKENPATAVRMRITRKNKDYNDRETLSNAEHKRVKRQCQVFRSKENPATAVRMRITRKNKDYNDRETLSNAEHKRVKRQCQVFRSKENPATAVRMRITRKTKNYHDRETLSNAEHKRVKRQCQVFRSKENPTTAVRMRITRKNKDYNERETLSNAEHKRVKRQCQVFRSKENPTTAVRMRITRKNKDYNERETLSNAEHKRVKRQCQVFRSKENPVTAVRMRITRKTKDYHDRETLSNAAHKRVKRQCQVFRSKENPATAVRMRKKRLDKNYSEKERKTNSERIKERRASVNYSQNEGTMNLDRIHHLREDDAFRDKEKNNDRIARQRARAVEILHFRDTLYNALLENRTNGQAKLYLSFIEQKKQFPCFICSSCEGSFFRNGVVPIKREEILKKLGKSKSRRKNQINDANLDSQVLNHYNVGSENYACHTCSKYIGQGVIPKLASSWGLKLPDVPDCVTRMNHVEERMASPIVPFMDIRPRSSRASNPQDGIKGSVIHIPVDVNEMVTSLPRNFDNLNLLAIPVDWKRRMEYKTVYLQGFVRPHILIEALNYLVNTELYKKHGVYIDQNFLLQLQNNSVSSSQAESQQHDASDQNDYDDDDFNNFYDEDDEVLLFDFNEQTANGARLVMAPGQNRYPVSVHKDRDIEYLSFPKLFGGQSRKIQNKNISVTDTIKWEIRYFKAHTTVHRLLYLAKVKLERDVLNSVQVALKKKANAVAVTAEQALNTGYITELVQHNDGLKFLSHIANSPSYWAAQKKKVFAMIRQLGKPVFFLTISAVETNWPELLQGLFVRKTGKKISLTDAMNLPSNERYQLVKEDPVFTARYYNYRMNELMKVITSSSGPFTPYKVDEYYVRREFQQRGAPHDHALLFLKDAPNLDLNDRNSFNRVIDFVDRFITCEFDENNPYCKYTRHKHTDTCSKGRKNKQSCRFNFPKFVMPETMILEPLKAGEKTKEVKENLQIIKDLMETFYKSKERVYKDFDAMLEELNMTRDDYITAIRCSTTKLAIFYKRRSCDVDINTYNRDILNLAEANIDLQFIVDEYAVAAYLVEYIAKCEGSISKGLKEVQEEVAKGNRSLQEQKRRVANKFLNSNVMCASEAAYHCLGTSLSKTSRAVIFINTSKAEERVVFLKSNAQLEKMDPHSTDITTGKSVIAHYSERKGLENVCLAEYAAYYFHTKNKPRMDKNDDAGDDLCDPEELNDTACEQGRRREKARILRYVNYKLNQDPDNFYREKLLLFLPWRDEEKEIETVNWKERFNTNLAIINENRGKLFALSDDVLEAALEAAEQNRNQLDEDENADFETDQIPKDQEIDILVQGGMDRPKNNVPFVFAAPPRIELPSYLETLKKLNVRQREIVMHIYKCFTSNQLPFRIFISGSAGVGKSMIVAAIYQLITHFLSYSVTTANAQQIDSLKVLLCALSGKASFLIGGNTLHSAFALPISEYGKVMKDLPMDVANNLRQQLLHCKLIIIDEISMAGSTTLSRIDTRLKQITGVKDDFGGIPIITVGDFMQLPPVKDRAVFLSPKSAMIELECSPLWDKFELYELTEVMRQKDDLAFVNALKNFTLGKMSDSDIKLFKSREVKESQVPDEAMRLYYMNDDVEAYNYRKMAASTEKEVDCTAVDTVTGRLTREEKADILNDWMHKCTSDCGGYPYTLLLKKRIKYMVTANLDVSDGLVNGATGTLMYVYCDPGTKRPKIVFLHFDLTEVGRKMRLQYKNFMENNSINLKWTPIPRKKYSLTNQYNRGYQVLRDQFPLVPCEALTIHKSQGQTYGAVCVDFRKPANLTRQLVYVALSRVSKLSGLYILGSFPGNMKENKTIVLSLNEMDRMRKERQLQLVYNNLENKNGKAVCYLNIRSLNKNLEHVLADQWYSRCDILIFSETGTHSRDHISIPGFEVIYRSDNSTYPSYVENYAAKGVVCFAKIGMQVEVIHTCQKFESDKRGHYHSHVDLMSLSVDGTLIITGYKSPKTTNDNFKNALSEFNIIANQPTVLLGDFNFNLNDSRSNHIKHFFSFMEGFNLKDCLQPSTATTILGSRLDVIFSNIMNLQTGVYDCYFSDHKPIFIILKKHVSVLECDRNSNDDYDNINENDRDIETFSYQCSDTDTDTVILNQNFSDWNVDWLNNINHPFNSDEVLESLRNALSKMYLHLELTTLAKEQSILTCKDSINHVVNYLKFLPTVDFNTNRDYHNQFSDQPLLSQGFKEIVISGAGNCQFNSISYALVGNENYSKDLRAIAFLTVVDNPQLFQLLESKYFLESETNVELLETCITIGEYGNTDTLFSLSIALEKCIIVMQIVDKQKMFFKVQPPIYDNSASPIFLHLRNPGNVSNAHYNVMLPVDKNVTYDFIFSHVYNLSTMPGELINMH